MHWVAGSWVALWHERRILVSITTLFGINIQPWLFLLLFLWCSFLPEKFLLRSSQLFLDLPLLAPFDDKLLPLPDDYVDGALFEPALNLSKVVKAGVHAEHTDLVKVTLANKVPFQVSLQLKCSCVLLGDDLARQQVGLWVIPPESLDLWSRSFAYLSN